MEEKVETTVMFKLRIQALEFEAFTVVFGVQNLGFRRSGINSLQSRASY